MFKRVLLFILCFFLTVASAAAISLQDETMIENTNISLKGEETVVLEVMAPYEELGAHAERGSDIIGYTPVEYVVTQNVNTSQLGEYKVLYQTDDNSAKTYRTVKVVDTQPPVISAPDEINVFIGSTVFDVKYTASDNYDGDITAKVKKTDGEDTVTLTVKDSSGNTTKKVVKVNFCADVTPPVISLGGFSEMCVKLGGTFTDPGYTATDNKDGNVTSSVTVSGSVDTSKVGTYEITYSATDAAKNTGIVKRRVCVYDNVQAAQGENPTGSVIYLTFDDGPGKYTQQLLNTLDSYGVKVTFFVTNQFPKYQHLIGAAYKAGHSIGVHTYSHQWSIYRSKEAYFDDFWKMNAIIEKQTGQKSRIFRFPGGTNNQVSRSYCSGIMSLLSTEMPKAGYFGYDWTVGSLDTELSSPAAIASQVKKSLKPGKRNIVLLHDIKGHTVNAIPEIIRYGITNGYKFATINENTPTHYFKPAN